MSSFIQLKHAIAQLKISPSLGIEALSKRFDTFRDYLSRCLWVAGMKRGEWPTAHDEDQKREILECTLLATYLTALSHVGWCLSENTYSAFLGKLNEIQPGIKRAIEYQKKTDANV